MARLEQSTKGFLMVRRILFRLILILMTMLMLMLMLMMLLLFAL